MLKHYLLIPLLALLVLLLAGWAAYAQAPVITRVSPGRNAGAAPRGANVAVTFSQVLQNTAATRGAVRVYSQQRGGQLRDGARATATVSGNTLTLDPTTDFKPGETLLVSTTPTVMGSGGGTLARGQVHQFTTATGGTGRGNFLPGADMAVGGSYPSNVAVADVDGDGDLDLLTTNTRSRDLSVRLNGGDASGSNTGAFSGGSQVAVGSFPQGLAVGDVDGDGDLDLLTSCYSYVYGDSLLSTVSVRLNGGDASGSNTGTFSGGATVRVGDFPTNVALGDVDGDGDLDLLTANSGNNTVSVRLNGGNATGSNTGTFSGGYEVAVGPGPQSVVLGDADGDGDLDLFTANGAGSTVSVRLNGGNATGSNTGTFSGGYEVAVGSSPQSVVLGDVDGDGDLDLLAGNAGSSTVSVRLNGGNATGSNTGTFSGGYEVAAGNAGKTGRSALYSMVLGDIDSDGDLDLLVVNAGSNTVNLRLNGGDATGSNTGVFSGGDDVAVGAAPQSVALGDIDGDGDLDLLTANNTINGTGSVRLNQPQPPPTISDFTPTYEPVGTLVTVSGTGLSGATLVTVNGTTGTIVGTPSATRLTFTVGVGSTTGPISVTTPVGTGTSSTDFKVLPPPTISSFTPASGPVGTSVTVSGTDLVRTTRVVVNGTAGTFVSAPTDPSLTFLVGTGSTTGPISVTTSAGTATSNTSFTVTPLLSLTGVSPGRNAGAAPRGANVAVTFSQALQNTAATRGAVRVYSQQRGGQLRDGARATATVSGNTLTLDPTTDFKPGETLLVSTTPTVMGSGGGTLARGQVHQFTAATGGTGRGNFLPGADMAVGGNSNRFAYGVAVADVDGDGDLDLLKTNYDSGTVSMRLNGGNASGSNTGVFSGGSDIAVGGHPVDAALGDVDGDGDLDLATANSDNNSVSVRLNGGDASGSNTGVFNGGSEVTVGEGPVSVVLGDVDGDGDLDLLAASTSNGSKVSVRLNGGDASGSNTGIFSGGSEVGVGNGPAGVVLGDVDGDGDLDLLTVNYVFFGNSSTMSVRLNGGDATSSNTGVFSGGSDSAVGSNPVDAALGDVDGDGDLDLLTANYNSGTVSVRLNNGAGLFSSGSEVAVGSHVNKVVLGDVDGDGDLDLLTANSGNNTVSVRLNGGDASGSNPGVFSGGSEVGVDTFPQGVALGDVDGDGDLDLLTANSGNNTVSVRLNQPPPTISSFTPSSGIAGTSVTVSGTYLGGATLVTVNGTAGTITSAPTAPTLTFTVGAGSTTGLISVTTPAGTATSSTNFTVVPTPTITSFSPTSGPAGTSVTVMGTNLSGATGLTLNGAVIPLGNITANTAASLTFTVPAGSTSGFISVNTPGGTATSSTSFTFLPPPAITSFSPNPAASGATITVTGTDLGGATGLTLNGLLITGFTVGSGGTTITFVVPTGATSGPISVTTPGGTATSSGSLTVDNVPPTATLSTAVGSSTVTAPIPFTATFSEGVKGFVAGGINVTGGTVVSGSVNGSSGGTTYTFTVLPTSSGTVTVRVGAGAAQDVAGNPNPASATLSVLYTAPPPTADLLNTGTLLTVQAGGILSVGTGGLGNQGGTLTNAGTLRIAGPLTNPASATLDLGAGTLEVQGDLTNAGTVRPGTSAVTFSGAADQLLTPGGATLYQVLVNKPTAGANTLRLAGDLTVSSNLTLTNGLVTTQSGTTLSTLRLPDGATLSSEASGRYVRGSLAITRTGVSGAAVDFGHGVLLDPTTNNLGTVTITRTAGLLTNDVSRGVNFANTAQQGIDRIYTLSATTPPSAAVQLTLSWLPDNDNGLTDFSQASAWQQATTGQPWVVSSPATSASARSLRFNSTTLGRFTVSNATNPLPVTLVDFTAQAEGPAARLRWATASELNNAGFSVERSLDGRTFAVLRTVAVAGTSATRHDYTLLDNQLPSGATLLYYRLGQTDLSGTVTYSPVRSVAFAPRAAGFVVYPTRVAGGQDATYLYTGPADAGRLDVLNVLGQVLRTVALDGRASGPVPLVGLATGTYLLRYTGPAGRFITRCVVE